MPNEDVLERADGRQNAEQYPLDYRQYIDRLKANAARCRELADSASDPEAMQTLLEIAGDIESAVPILEQDAHRKGDE